MKTSTFPFSQPTLTVKIIKRYKRFLADVLLPNGETETVHVPNSGSMATCWEPNAIAIISDYGHIKTRKLKYTLQAVKMPDGWIGVNTQNPNKAVEKAILESVYSDFSEYDYLQPEVKISSESRLDLVLWKKDAEVSCFKISKTRQKNIQKTAVLANNGANKSPEIQESHQNYQGHEIQDNKNTEPICFIEIKNVTLLHESNAVSFPDAKTLRGQKHLKDLIELKNAGHRAVILFFIERNSAEWMTVADDIDPDYGKLLRSAISRGVEAIAIKAYVSEEGLILKEQIPIRL